MVFSSLKKKIHEWFQSSGWASKHWQFLRICTDHSYFHLLPPILILVFPQSATFKVYIVWRARDGQIGEGIIELAHPSSGWATLYWDQYIQKHSRTFAISAFLSLPRYTNFYFKNIIKLNRMYPCVLKVFSICWGTQKSSRQDPIFFKVLQKGNFSQHWEWCGTETAKLQEFEAGWETAGFSAAKLCCWLTPDKQSVPLPFHPLHCTEPHNFLHSHVTTPLLWPC